jgi:hypothetical protein
VSDIGRVAQKRNTKLYPLSDDLTEDAIAEAEGLLEDTETLSADNWNRLGWVARQLIDKIERERGAK